MEGKDSKAEMLTKLGILEAEEAELEEWCRQRGLDSTGSVAELRERLLDYLGRPVLEEPTPAYPAPPIPPPVQPRKTGRWIALFLVIVTIIVVIVAALAFQPRQEAPGEDGTTVSESQYLSSVSRAVLDGSTTLSSYIEWLGLWEPTYNDEIVAAGMRIELQNMKDIRSELQNMDAPCPAYQQLHNDIISAITNYVDGMAWGITGVEDADADADAFDTGTDYFMMGNQYLNFAQSELDDLQMTLPKCAG